MIPRVMRIWLCTEPVDFHKGINGLCAVVQNELGGDPLSGHLWVFFSRDRRAVKLLVWDTGGFLLIHKRLEQGRFRLPRSDGKTARMTAAELTALLEGIDLSTARRLPRWNPVEETVVSGKERVIPASP